MNNAITIRPMRKEDLDQIMIIENTLFPMAWARNTYLSELHQRHTNYLVATIDGEIAGYFGLQIVYDEAQISVVATAPSYRRCGVAKALLERQMAYSWECDCERIVLEVRVSNDAAIGLYEQYGFRKTDILPAYYADNNEDAYEMTCFRRSLADSHIALIARDGTGIRLYFLKNEKIAEAPLPFSSAAAREKILRDIRTAATLFLVPKAETWSAIAVNGKDLGPEQRGVIVTFLKAYAMGLGKPFLYLEAAPCTMATTTYERYLSENFAALGGLPIP